MGPLDCFPGGCNCIQVCVYQNLEDFQWSSSCIIKSGTFATDQSWTLDVGDVVTFLTYAFFKTPFGSIIFFARFNIQSL